MFIHLTLTVLVYSAAEATNIKVNFPPPSNNSFPRLRLDKTLPNLRELTFCSWVKVHQLNGSNLAPVLSYATSRNSNEFLVSLFNRNEKAIINVQRGTPEVNVDCESNCYVGYWCHICVSWFGASGRVETFANGKKCKEAFLNYHEPYLPSGGVLIIGQEQDGLDKYYEVNQAWIGDIADFQLWDEALSNDQVEEAGVCKGKRKEGTIVSWLKTPMVALDGVVFSATQLCLP